jgi:acyl carrier protein
VIDSMAIKEAIRGIFVEELGIDAEVFSEDLKYNSIPEWDSASHMVIAAAIEDCFELVLDDDDIVFMTSVGKIYELLQRRGINFE